MDIEKMIEQLRYLADTPSYTAFHNVKEREIICDQCEAGFCHDKQQDAHWCMYEALSRAATALSTLQAENERLKVAADNWEKKYVDANDKWIEAENKWDGLDKAVRNGSVYRPMQEELNLTHEENQSLKDVNEKLRAELEEMTQRNDENLGMCKIWERRYSELQAELEQAKRCIEIVERQRDEAIEELEKYMAQDVLEGNEPCSICVKASNIPCEYCNPRWR